MFSAFISFVWINTLHCALTPLSNDAVTIVSPSLWAVSLPLSSTVATLGLLTLQVILFSVLFSEFNSKSICLLTITA